MVKAMFMFIIKCFKDGGYYGHHNPSGIEESLLILNLTWTTPTPEIKLLINQNFDIIDSLTWVLECDSNHINDHVAMKTHAMLLMKSIIEFTSSNLLERLKHDFFNLIIKVIRDRISHKAIKAALHVLIDVCPWGRNRQKIVESGAVFELIQLELERPEKKTTELIFSLLAHLCSCADGRSEFLGHAGGIAMVTKRLLRVSPGTDDRAVQILALIAKFSGTKDVLMEMLRVGAVSKLCMVIQADCATYLKAKARGVLRLHSNVWNNSPCIAVYLLTWYPR